MASSRIVNLLPPCANSLSVSMSLPIGPILPRVVRVDVMTDKTAFELQYVYIYICVHCLYADFSMVIIITGKTLQNAKPSPRTLLRFSHVFAAQFNLPSCPDHLNSSDDTGCFASLQVINETYSQGLTAKSQRNGCA